MRYFIVFFILCAGCGTNPNKPYSDTPTSGKVRIATDETFTPLANAQLDTFHALYRYAHITNITRPESELFRLLINDSVKVIMAARKLNEGEEKYFREKNLFPVTTKVAIDALAIIVNKDNPDSLLKISTLKKILSGEIKSWKQINASSKSGNLSFVFDQNGSSTVSYLQSHFMDGKSFPSWCFAAKSNTSVIEYVEKHPEAIGVIGVNWISDKDDSDVIGFLSRIKVVALAANDNATVDDYYKPYQGYIAEKSYPLVREIYMINREGRAGLGTGFVSFVAGDQGQRIIRLMGLLPATMPIRIVRTQ